MTTNELIKLIEELGLTPDFDHVLYCDGEERDVLSVFNREGTVANVYVNMVGLWYCHESYFDKLEPHKRHKLLDAIIEYSYTPVIDREEEKRYIFPLPGLITTDGEQQYLTQKGDIGLRAGERRICGRHGKRSISSTCQRCTVILRWS